MPEEVRRKAVEKARDACQAGGTLTGLSSWRVAASTAAGSAYAEGLAVGRADERARVVAHLRAFGNAQAGHAAKAALYAAAVIEAGEHLGD